ncbi:MAG: alpha/beta hydrolase [Saprospiraceae bacterium]|nr:alpha/beta hydrolase [Saprospiraceae bacterium]
MTPPPLLLLHGALGSAEQFAELMPMLPDDRSVWALNLPGHGGLPLKEPFSMTLFAEAILAFMDREAWEVADIFGYSMGGYAALQFALLHPERVRGIVTLGTKFDWTPESAEREKGMLDPAKIEAKVPQFAAALAERHAPADWKTLLRYTADLLHGLGNGQVLTQADFARIEAPVVIMRGELDHMVGEAESRQVAEWLPDGMYETLEGTKHPWEQVNPERFVRALLRIIR